MSNWTELQLKEETENIGYRAEDLSEILARIRNYADSVDGVDLKSRKTLSEINRLSTLAIGKIIPDLMLSNYKQFTMMNKKLNLGDENV